MNSRHQPWRACSFGGDLDLPGRAYTGGHASPQSPCSRSKLLAALSAASSESRATDAVLFHTAPACVQPETRHGRARSVETEEVLRDKDSLGISTGT